MRTQVRIAIVIVFLFVLAAAAQQAGSSASAGSLQMAPPPLIQFSGVAMDDGGNATGNVELTFSLYTARQGGEPLWSETQDLALDPLGRYSVPLGITRPDGVPAPLFTSGGTRWLGVRIAGQAEQPRILLVSVPYALKAGDAATLGGLPPSAFLLAAPASANAGAVDATNTTSNALPPASAVTGTGTVGFLSLWDTTSDIIGSALFQSGSGATAKVGINTTTPASMLDVNGSVTIRGPASVLGSLGLPAAGTATATAGKTSDPLSLTASAFSSTGAVAVPQTFQLQAEPVGNDTATPSGTLNLLFRTGATTHFQETGLKLASNGQITFASGQAFPGAGTITGVTTATGSGLIGGGKTGTLNLGLTNTCAANQILHWTGTAWACASPGTGTVTSVGSGAGLTGGPITGSGTLSIATGGVSNAMLVNPSLTVSAGTGLTGGGAVSLGGNTTLNVDATKIPVLAANNVFSAHQIVTTSDPQPAILGNSLSTTAGAFGVEGASVNTSGVGVYGINSASVGNTYGVVGLSQSPTGVGVFGGAETSSGVNIGVSGLTYSLSGYGVYGSSPTGGFGVYSNTALGVVGDLRQDYAGVNPGAVTPGGIRFGSGNPGEAIASDRTGTNNLNGIDLYTNFTPRLSVANNGNIGINTQVPNALLDVESGSATSAAFNNSGGGEILSARASGFEVFALQSKYSLESTAAIIAVNDSTNGEGEPALYVRGGLESGPPPSGFSFTFGGAGLFVVGGDYTDATGSGNGGTAIEAYGGNNTAGTGVGGDGVFGMPGPSGFYAGDFNGNVNVSGVLTSGTKDFKIDHPLDPANRYLLHASIESDEMLNLYTGNAVLNENGSATVQLPDWFEIVNGDFRYQLTAVGRPSPGLYIAQEISGGSFQIAGGTPGGKVSWQVSGVRHDAFCRSPSPGGGRAQERA